MGWVSQMGCSAVPSARPQESCPAAQGLRCDDETAPELSHLAAGCVKVMSALAHFSVLNDRARLFWVLLPAVQPSHGGLWQSWILLLFPRDVRESSGQLLEMLRSPKRVSPMALGILVTQNISGDSTFCFYAHQVLTVKHGLYSISQKQHLEKKKQEQRPHVLLKIC